MTRRIWESLSRKRPGQHSPGHGRFLEGAVPGQGRCCPAALAPSRAEPHPGKLGGSAEVKSTRAPLPLPKGATHLTRAQTARFPSAGAGRCSRVRRRGGCSGRGSHEAGARAPLRPESRADEALGNEATEGRNPAAPRCRTAPHRSAKVGPGVLSTEEPQDNRCAPSAERCWLPVAPFLPP